MQVVRVTSGDDLEALFRFRYAVCVDELGWLAPDASGLLRDPFDDVAANYAALDEDGSVIGSMRVVPDSPLGLPLEQCNPLEGPRSGKRMVELCRFMVRDDHRGSRLASLLMKAGLQWAVMTERTHVLLDSYVEEATIGLYERMGFERIAGPYSDPSSGCDLLVVTMEQAISKMDTEWPTLRPGLLRFFRSDDPAIDHRVGQPGGSS